MFTDQSHKSPFTGRGSVRAWRSQMADNLSQVHREMDSLSGSTKQMPTRVMYLERHLRDGALKLRWRLTTGEYRTWSEMLPHVATLQQTLRDWYTEANRMAQQLNALESGFRTCVAALQTANEQSSETL